MKPRVGAIVGPTASGKTALAAAVAQRLCAEIVSIDSMQIYRGMDIGTGKASSELRARVPHHLIDVKEPSEELTVAEFQALARAVIAEVSGRGKFPLLVGGSGLYFRAVVDELRFPPTEPDIRARLEEESERLGADALHERLRELDPASAARIEPANTRRTVRALEVIEITGRPFSENAHWDRYESIYDLRAVGLALEREMLDRRIEARVRDMLAAGLVEEVRHLEAGGMGRTARMALGYRQVLDRPDGSIGDLQGAIVRATRRFARRQDSWFRADPRIRWIEGGGQGITELLAEHFS